MGLHFLLSLAEIAGMTKLQRLSVLLVAFLLPFPAFNQDSAQIHHLEKELESASGKQRMEALNELSWEIKFSDLNRAISLAGEAMQLAERADDERGLLFAYKNLGACYFLKTELPKAEEYIDKALGLIQYSEDLYSEGKIYNLKAIISRELHKTGIAFNYQNKALEIFRSINDSTEISGNMHNLAILYERVNEHEKAIVLYYEVFEIEKRLGNKYGIARTANNLGGVYSTLGFLDKAIEYYTIAAENFAFVGNSMGQAAALHGLGVTELEKGQFEKAISFLKQALAINEPNGYNEYIINNDIKLGECYIAIGDYNSALASFNLSKEIAFRINDLEKYGISLVSISKAYQLLGNTALSLEYAGNALTLSKLNGTLQVWSQSSYLLYQLNRDRDRMADAVKYLEDYIEVTDSIRKIERENALLEINAKYEFELMEKENARLVAGSKLNEQVIKSQKILLGGMIIVAVLLLLLSALIVINHKKIRHKNLLLQESNATRDKFFSIIAHDLKNPFSGLLGFSELLKRNIEIKDRQTLKAYADTLYKAINNTYQLVENLLDWSRTQRKTIVVAREDISVRELVDIPVSLLSEAIKDKKITLENNVPREIVINTDKNILSTVLRNLISNAIKFTNENGSVEITAQLRDRGVIISVADNGIGIDNAKIHQLFKLEQSFTSKGTNAEPGTGLGLMLCREFVEKLDGKIWVESELGKGSTFSFFLPETV